MPRKNLLHYRYNKYSQNGEDGIIEELCRRLDITKGWFVEFGAWDGKHLSNSYRLLSEWGWSGVDIEADPDRYRDLLTTRAAFPDRLHTICAFVGFEGENTLDNLLARTPLPRDFDLLSIDIDSYDWQVWKSLANYHPRIVIIEGNSLLSPGVYKLHDPPDCFGASFSALLDLGTSKGYRLVCHTGNCFFVLNELVPKLELDALGLASPDRLFNYPKQFRERLLAAGRKVFPARFMALVYRASHRWKRLRRRR